MASSPVQDINPSNQFVSQSDRISTDSSESVDPSNDRDCECHDGVDFPFSVKIPTVVLRRPRTSGAYFVYTICVTIRKTEHTESIADHKRSHSISRLEWSVGHRYSTLELLHADLMGQNIHNRYASGVQSSMDEGMEDNQWEKEELETSKPQGNYGGVLAHLCLPRPLPGLECFRFPRRRIVPTIPTLAAGRFPACLKDCSDWITCQSEYVDYPVVISECPRVDQRRRALEQYLNRLIRLVWCVSQTQEVDDVLRATGVENIQCNKDVITCDDITEFGTHVDNDDLAELKQIKTRLISLLPILSEDLQ